MIKYDSNGELIFGLLDDSGVISKEAIKEENYKQYKKDFDEIVEILTLNKLYHSLYTEILDYHISDDLEFVTLADDTYKTASRVKDIPILLKEDNQVFTMDKALYKTYYELCCDLLIKVKRSWNQLNEVEKFIIKSLEFDIPPDTDENISYKLKYDSKKYYQYKESGFIKLGMQLKVSGARNTNLIPCQQFENINVDFY
jgi:hypothetical protein